MSASGRVRDLGNSQVDEHLKESSYEITRIRHRLRDSIGGVPKGSAFSCGDRSELECATRF